MKSFTIKFNEIKELGEEHERNEYKLLRWLSTQFNGSIILEVGTLSGRGANALSYNPRNLVITLDCDTPEDIGKKQELVTLASNVVRMIGNVHEIDLTWLSKVDLIYLDIQHKAEELDRFLKNIEPYFKGILIVDATNSNKFSDHRYYFNALSREKQQLPTVVAGCRGTGVIPYGDWIITLLE